MRILLGWLVAMLSLMTGAPAMASTVLIRSFHSEALNRDWSYTIYLPTGYDQGGPRLPVIYLLHGNNGNANDWILQGCLQASVDALIERKDIAPIVIVMPQGGTDWYVDRKEAIETAFFSELMPEIDARFRVSRQRDERVVGGVSMGGFGALRYAMTRPDIFGSAILLSPAIYANEPPPGSSARWVGVFGATQFDPRVWHALNYPAQWRAYLRQPLRVPMFIAFGDDDFAIQAEACKLYTHLRACGNPAALRIVDGGHTWAVWRNLLGDALRYALVRPRSR
ncbi:esterase family protein [Mycetohabitans sp. B8]|uniref:alpha/beta hydrolase n=1 Tax=Mycetohabitans sp. B8 TaxID=2841845 RepID=UPI001F2A5332|nr:alpha/beta hydrolase-fold protein [Mycetohabitans sp. B8]MCG1042354.1 esterase family protein [Mycetohabitans sp. B8]